MSKKSNEFDIRKAVVRKLLDDGHTRENIRIEIPLDTASYTGRADIVVLTNKIYCLELKSGKDKFCPEALRQQCAQYNRSFDGVGAIIDRCHKREWEEAEEHGTWQRTNWRDVDLQYCHETGEIQTGYDKKIDLLLPNYDYRFMSRKTSVYDMACLLWASEVQALAGFRRKSSYTDKMREEGCLRDVRPIVISALRKRPLNLWEARFWKEFDK